MTQAARPHTPSTTGRAVLDVLAGEPIADAAHRAGMEPTDLAAAVEVYQQAGRRALEEQAAALDWWQLYIEFADWPGAERVAADHLVPLLHRAESHGAVTAWWFIRKHPYWRLRLRTQPHGSGAKASVGASLDELAAAGHIERWWPGIYEPETAAFGGGAGMEVAHQLFHADSRAVLAPAACNSQLGRRELSVLLCTTLMRAAGLEWYEQGDAWHRVAQERPLSRDVPLDRLQQMAGNLRALMFADTELDGPLLGPNGTLMFAAEWADAFRRAGRTLGAANREGTLDRGLRHIISYHVIFHWNRLGLPARTQSVLAWAARTAILDPPASVPNEQALM